MANRHRADITKPETNNEFYETMPLYSQPHSVFRDDAAPADTYDEPQVITQDDIESAQLSAKLTALLTLAAMILLGIVLILLAVYGLNAASSAATPASLAGGSLEL